MDVLLSPKNKQYQGGIEESQLCRKTGDIKAKQNNKLRVGKEDIRKPEGKQKKCAS